MIIGATVKLLFAYVLIGKYGIFGAPISTVLGYVVSLFVSLFFSLLFGVVRISDLAQIAIPAFAAFISVFLTRQIYSRLFLEFSAGGFVSSALLCAVLYAAVILLLNFRKAKNGLKYVKNAKNT